VSMLRKHDSVKNERGNIITWSVARRLFRTGAILVLFLGCVAILHQAVWAAGGTVEPASAQAAVGPVPLLAALGIGIAAAVGAVIAFLQLTAKGRDQRTAAVWPDAEPAVVPPAEDRDEPTGYTIPLNRVGPLPVPPEPEDEGQPRLCGVEGVFAGSCFRLTSGGLSIGRDPSVCSIVFPLDIGEVSRRHCTLMFEEDQRLFLLEDHGSSNGTFLPGGLRLEPGKRYELRSGERFALSGTVHWFEVRE
jgi:hypothetical protein